MIWSDLGIGITVTLFLGIFMGCLGKLGTLKPKLEGKHGKFTTVQNMDIERQDWGFGQNSRISSPDVDLDLDPIPFLGSTALTHVFQKWRTSVALDRTPKEGPLFSWIQYSSDTIKP